MGAKKYQLEMPGIEPGASYMQSMRSTTELHPLRYIIMQTIFIQLLVKAGGKVKIYSVPTARLELAIFGLGDRRLIHWATRACLLLNVIPTRYKHVK